MVSALLHDTVTVILSEMYPLNYYTTTVKMVICNKIGIIIEKDILFVFLRAHSYCPRRLNAMVQLHRRRRRAV